MQKQASNFIRIKEILSPPVVSAGNGITLISVLDHKKIDQNTTDPFILMSYHFGIPKAGFPDHPHKGFCTITYQLAGKTLHEDFLGNKGFLEAGDVQWMTAGRGIVHSEIPSSLEEPYELFQIWLNLRSMDKMQAPSYQEIKAASIPKITKDGVTVGLIAGEALGQKGPITARTPTYLIDVHLQKNSVYEQLIPAGYNSFAFVYKGESFFGEKEQLVKNRQTVYLQNENDRDQLIIKTKHSECNFILLAGQPLKEPVAQHGPFVMNTREELLQAFDDYSNYRNGFENARNWESDLLKAQQKQRKK